MGPRTDILTSLLARPDGADIRILSYGRIRAYRSLVKRGFVLEKEATCYITDAGKAELDANPELLPCRFKEFLFSQRPPNVVQSAWNSWVTIHLDEEETVLNIRTLLPEKKLRFRTDVMDSDPHEICVKASGELADGSWCPDATLVLLSPEREKEDAPLSTQIADCICRNIGTLRELLTPVVKSE